jgi:hypothetical protein
LQVSSGDTDRLVLICFLFTFKTPLCGSLKGLDHLFDQFPTIFKYFSDVLV